MDALDFAVRPMHTQQPYASSFIFRKEKYVPKPGERNLRVKACYAALFGGWRDVDDGEEHGVEHPILWAKFDSFIGHPMFAWFWKNVTWPFIPDDVKQAIQLRRIFAKNSGWRQYGWHHGKGLPEVLVGIDTRKITASHLFAVLTWMRTAQEYGNYALLLHPLRRMFPEIPICPLFMYATFCQRATANNGHIMTPITIDYRDEGWVKAVAEYDVKARWQAQWDKDKKQGVKMYAERKGKTWSLHDVFHLDRTAHIPKFERARSYQDYTPEYEKKLRDHQEGQSAWPLYSQSKPLVIKRHGVEGRITEQHLERWLRPFVNNWGVKL